MNIFIVSPVFIAIFMVARGENPAHGAGRFCSSPSLWVCFLQYLENHVRLMYRFQANSAVDNLENLFNEMAEKKIEFGTDENMKDTTIEFRDVDFSYDGENKVLTVFL